MAVHDHELSRRERKSLRTRREIVRAAAELVLEEGYERATIARIADRADLATRTVTTRFRSKEEIFLEGIDDAVQLAERHLSEGPGDVIDRLRAWIDALAETAEREPEDPEIRLLRSRAVARDPDLRGLLVQRLNRAHDAIARAVANGIGEAPDRIGPQMIAAAAISALNVLEHLAAEDSDQILAELERGFRVLRGAFGALTSNNPR